MVIGMAHRGRINVLANFMDKGLEVIFSEFDGTAFNKKDFDRERSLLEDAISRVETEATSKRITTEASPHAPAQPSDIGPTLMTPLPSVGSWLKGVFRRIWRDCLGDLDRRNAL